MSEASTIGASELPNASASAGETSAAPATAGGLLRVARERQGVHLAVLAASLKVTPRKLEQLEADRHDELLDATFVRALALSMCRVLKIDPEPVLSRLPQVQGRGLDHASRGINQPYLDRNDRGDGIQWRRLLSLPLIGAALLVIAALLVYWLPPGAWSLSALLPRAGVPALSPSSVGGVEATPRPAQPRPVVDPVAELVVPQAAAGAASEPATPMIETVFSAPAGAASAPIAGGILSLRADAESWVEVRDASGQILLSRHLAAGEAVGLNGALPLRLVIGNAEATQVLFRGQRVTLNPARDNVARLDLK